ncbi:MAG: hypothetical protein FJ286_10010 [Planctomycetes bacterium]|nr:hypothetical protein [Planctomycetota bacterium]
MPRAKRLIRKRFVEGTTEVLEFELEETLLRGRGILGVALELRTREDWVRLWARWRDTIMPKALEHRPGQRPFAQYVVGEIPARPVVIEPPMVNGFFKLYVPSRNGTGTWYFDYPQPYMEAEARYLRDIGVVDAAEWKRYLAKKRRGYGPYRGPDDLDGYTLEVGLHQ